MADWLVLLRGRPTIGPESPCSPCGNSVSTPEHGTVPRKVQRRTNPIVVKESLGWIMPTLWRIQIRGCRAGIRTPTKGSKGLVLDSKASGARVSSGRQVAHVTLAASPLVAAF
jgi:hypothetical protein